MKIDDAIIKSYLKNVYFITGTAYAGKSTICHMIANRLDLRHCKENYCYDDFLSLTTPKSHPHMNYFKTMKSWEAFVTRSPKAYSEWIFGVSREIAPFEIIELISLSKKKKVIVDTNIPIDILKRISDKKHVAVLLTNEDQSVENFFDRDDPEKQFLLREIKKTKRPDHTMKTFKEGLRLINGQKIINEFEQSGFKCFWRDKQKSLEDQYQEVVKHFALH
ncbi:MAG TPA: hypothetical protein VJ878_02655 [Candidatus Izemoplasmatales bacterium]|nr:hypothetical protein [Candidatus Izemoplasmatales bacterium]